MSKNEHAAALGRLNKGRKKVISEAEKTRRRESLKIARLKRHPQKSNEPQS